MEQQILIQTTKIQAAPIYRRIQKAFTDGFTIISEQGSARSAKTYNTVLWLINRCLQVSGTTVTVCRATFPSLRSSVLRDFIDILNKMNVPCRFNQSTMMLFFPNGSWVEFFSCDNEQKLRGRKRQILFVNEANEISYMAWQQLQMRTTLLTIIDYNPSFTDEHWICGVNKDKRTFHFISTYKDNPFLEENVINEIESLKEKNYSLWQIYGLGIQAAIEGRVYENFTEIETIPPAVLSRHYIGIDFGYSQDPTAIVDVYFSADNQDIYLNEYCYKTKMLSGEIITELKKAQQRPYLNDASTKIIADSADPRLIDEIHKAGLNIHAVKKYAGSILAGVNRMQGMRIFVTKSSVNIIKELRNYVFQKDKEGKWLNDPVDTMNHALDAARYVVLTEILGKMKATKGIGNYFF